MQASSIRKARRDCRLGLVPALLVVALMPGPRQADVTLFASATSDARQSEGKCDDPWTVCLFRHPNYLGDRLVYTIGPGMRQVSVPVLPEGWDDQVSSIKVGANVAFTFFIHRYWGREDSPMARNPWDQLFDGSVQDLGSHDVNDKLSSFVVFPRARKSPLGAWANDVSYTPLWYSSTPKHEHLFPVADSEDEAEMRYAQLGQCDLDKNMNEVWGLHPEVEVVLYEGRDYQGASLTIPGDQSSWATLGTDTNLGRYGWSDRAASMVVRWKGPSPGRPKNSHFGTSVGMDYPGNDLTSFVAKNGPVECEKACLADAKCKGYTWLQDEPACYLKLALATPVPNAACISGNRIVPIRVDAPPWPSFVVEYGVNRPGDDYKSFALKGGPEECQQACATDPTCKSFTWAKPGAVDSTAGCWLKSSIPVGMADNATVSGYVKGGTPDAAPPPPGSKRAVVPRGTIMSRPPAASTGPTIILEPGYDRPGYDYRSFTVQGDHSACQAACAADPKCRSFTWIKAGVQRPEAMCWLKTDVPKAVPNANAVSGVVK